MLTKAETKALYHAVDWMKLVLREWRKENPGEANSDAFRQECERLKTAQKALRKLYTEQRAATQGDSDA